MPTAEWIEQALHTAPLLLGLCVLGLVIYYRMRLRFYKLATRYADWQTEAQEVEQATHQALCSGGSGYPHVSVVVPSRNQAQELDVLLSRLFGQAYEGRFEVVVADEQSEDDTPEVLARYQREYERLRVTRTPLSSRHIELRKLAITLGIKASRGTWVIVLTPDTVPASKHWLQHYAQHLTEGVNFVEAYYNSEDDGSLHARRAVVDNIHQFILRLRGYERGIVAGCASANWAVRKEWFISMQGFADSLCLPFGEESIFANLHAEAETTAFLCSPETRLIENALPAHNLRQIQVARAEVRRHHTPRTRRLYLQNALASWGLYLFLMANTAYTLLRIGQDVEARTYTLDALYTDIPAFLLWVAGVALPVCAMRKSLRSLDEHPYGIYLWVYDFMKPWHTLATQIRHRMAGREFVRKYL